MEKRITMMELDDYIQRMNRARNLDEILETLKKQTARMGFEKLTYWVRWPSFETKRPIFITTYPQKFIDHYL